MIQREIQIFRSFRSPATPVGMLQELSNRILVVLGEAYPEGPVNTFTREHVDWDRFGVGVADALLLVFIFDSNRFMPPVDQSSSFSHVVINEYDELQVIAQTHVNMREGAVLVTASNVVCDRNLGVYNTGQGRDKVGGYRDISARYLSNGAEAVKPGQLPTPIYPVAVAVFPGAELDGFSAVVFAR